MNQSDITSENITGELNATGNATTRFEATTEGMAVAYSSLLFMALFPIVVGSFKSVAHVTKQKLSGNMDDVEVMTNKDAMMFPVYGSGVLLGIYLVFRFIDKDLVNVLFTVYFFVLGVIALTRVLEPVVRSLIPLPRNVQYKVLLLTDEKPAESDESEKSEIEKDTNTFVSAINAVLSKGDEGDAPPAAGDEKPPVKENSLKKWNVFNDLIVNYNFDYFTILSLLLSSAVGAWYLTKKHWIANNLFGLAFSINGIEFLQLDNVMNGCILLGGLFFYDVFWVFATDVMVTVAKSFEAPIKLIVPQDLPEKGLGADNYAMLGLGDIVIPGIFVALCLRIDHSFAQKAKKAVSKVYFFSAFSAYVLGLVTTISVMHYFKHAQPALLYLVPSCLGIPLFVGLVRGEIKPLFDYVDSKAKDAEEVKPASAKKSKKEK